MLRQLMHSLRLELPCFLFQLSYSGRFKLYSCNFIFYTPCEHKIPVRAKNHLSTRDMDIKMQPYSLHKRFHVPSLAYPSFLHCFRFLFFCVVPVFHFNEFNILFCFSFVFRFCTCLFLVVSFFQNYAHLRLPFFGVKAWTCLKPHVKY